MLFWGPTRTPRRRCSVRTGSVSRVLGQQSGPDLTRLVSTVSQSIQAINEAVDGGDAAQTLAALRGPGAGLYGVTSECGQTYQDDLAQLKEERTREGESGGFGSRCRRSVA